MRVGSVSRESVTERLDVLLYREKPTNQLALFCLPAGAASHSFSFDHRRRPVTLRRAIATAFFWPTSVIPVLTQHYAMLQRNLLYTGVTRGKRLVVLALDAPEVGRNLQNHP